MRRAFKASGVRKIHFPDSVEEICEESFLWCHSLSLVTFSVSSSLKRIGGLAFWESGVREIHLPAGVEPIPGDAFSSYKLLGSLSGDPPVAEFPKRRPLVPED